ncbi:hypothetical protein TEA_025096 [Camellia sinensis var. sinensis]|uniref:Tetratricopeptide repeat protein 5 OB fold domain-containing protein n=1 Tax=Camellia sinensis var. sinensis TaxID=542762 RepID=A0A4S4E1B7_CAMSN|nr:hypothetical protein TEA_025096 [Camellia sinensis var. sinensis]
MVSELEYSEIGRVRVLSLHAAGAAEQPRKCMAHIFLCDWSMGSQQTSAIFKSISKCYNLGNAWLTFFFVTGAWDHSKLLQSLKAYQNAKHIVSLFVVIFAFQKYEDVLTFYDLYQEKDESMNSNPDLSFNCATFTIVMHLCRDPCWVYYKVGVRQGWGKGVRRLGYLLLIVCSDWFGWSVTGMFSVNKYLENYERALTNFESAASRDPGLNAAEEAHKIVNLLDKLESLLRGQTKTKRLVSLASSLAAVNLNPSYRRATIDSLSEGLNKQVAIIGKVLFFVKHENVAPLYYLVCDSNHFCYVLSVYGIRDDAIKEGDQLTLVEPNYRNVDFSWKGKFYQFRSVRVDFLEQVLVNGKALSFQQAVRSSIHAQHKP